MSCLNFFDASTYFVLITFNPFLYCKKNKKIIKEKKEISGRIPATSGHKPIFSECAHNNNINGHFLIFVDLIPTFCFSPCPPKEHLGHKRGGEIGLTCEPMEIRT